MLGVGLSLPPDEEFLELVAPLLADAVDYFEIAPETTWWEPPDSGAEPARPTAIRSSVALVPATQERPDPKFWHGGGEDRPRRENGAECRLRSCGNAALSEACPGW